MQSLNDLNCIEIDITKNCNLMCFNCDRGCGIVKRNYFMQIDTIQKFIDESIKLNKHWERIKLLGGEPSLHPNLLEMTILLGNFKKNTGLVDNLQITTNGYGPRIRDLWTKIPSEWFVQTTNKESNIQPTFDLIYIAPIDIDSFSADNLFECWIPTVCGVSLSEYGYNLCGCGASIDDIFNLKLSVPNLSDLTPEKLRFLRQNLCKYCGHYNNYIGLLNDEIRKRSGCFCEAKEPKTKTWIKAIREYHVRNKPIRSPSMKVSIVIPASNPYMLDICLQSIKAQNQNLIQEIIVVEDWTYSDYHAIEKLCKKYSAKYMKLETAKRHATDMRQGQCRNMGQDSATGDIVLFLDQDCLLCEGYIDRICEIHEDHDKIIFYGDRIKLCERVEFFKKLEWDKVIGQWNYRLAKRGRLTGFEAKWYELFPDGTGGCVLSNNLSIQRKYISSIGEWECFYSYGTEDIYWNFKAMLNGIDFLRIKEDEDIFVCHIYHDINPLYDHFDAVNRLYIFEICPEMQTYMDNYEQRKGVQQFDTTTVRVHKLQKDGLQTSEVFKYLPPLPDCLKKYVKNTTQPSKND